MSITTVQQMADRVAGLLEERLRVRVVMLIPSPLFSPPLVFALLSRDKQGFNRDWSTAC